MATSLHRLVQNVAWNLETLSPTESSLYSDAFERIDRFQVTPETARSRTFSVLWQDSDPPDPEGVQDIAERWAEHGLQLEVYYRVGQSGLGWEDAQLVILQDRHDIIKSLRDTANFDGYDPDNTSTDIGLVSRNVAEDVLDIENEGLWILRQRWRCCVREAE